MNNLRRVPVKYIVVEQIIGNKIKTLEYQKTEIFETLKEEYQLVD